MATSILEVSGIGPASAKLLAGHGINSAEDLAGAIMGELTVVPGFSEIRAQKVIAAARLLAGQAPEEKARKGPKEEKAINPEKSKKQLNKKDKKEIAFPVVAQI